MNRLVRWLPVLLALMLTACSVPGATRPTVKIGLVAPFEGRYRYVGYSLFAAVRLALREANTAGGVGADSHRYSVELIAYDDGADPSIAREQAEKLAVDPQVVVVIGHFREETTRAALPIYASEGLPLVAPAVLAPELTVAEGTVIRVGPDADVIAAALAAQVEGSHAGLITDGGPLGQALERKVAERGITLSPVLTAVERLPSDPLPPAFFCTAPPTQCGEALAALHARGWVGEFIGGPDMASGEFGAVAGEAAPGARLVTPWPFPQDLPGCTEFVTECTRISLGIPPGPLALPAYQATQRALCALEWAIAQEGTPSRQSVALGLTATSCKPLTGFCGEPVEKIWTYQFGAQGWELLP